MNFQALLPELIPQAITWAERHADHIAKHGAALSEHGLVLAQRVGVTHPERVRIMLVDQVPIPEQELMKQVALDAGLLGPNTHGLTLGHSIYLLHGSQSDVRLVSHELRHVYQYEVLGGIHKFMPVYLEQLATHGYQGAPLEQDARAHEPVNP